MFRARFRSISSNKECWQHLHVFKGFTGTSCFDGLLQVSDWEQMTGLTDKNGKDVFEGDLIKNDRGRTGRVVWQRHTAAFDTDFVSDDGTSPNPAIDKSYGFKCYEWNMHIEVIGNIYENPELLEATQ